MEPDPRLAEMRAAWEDKPALRAVYADYYRRLAGALRPGPTLEVGGGAGNLKSFAPGVLSKDILEAPWLDLMAVERLSFLAYPLSGGYRSWSLLPERLVEAMIRVEGALAPALGRLAAFRLFVVLDRA